MNLQKMIKLWPQYQNWLKKNGITLDNAQEKIPTLINQMQQNPDTANQISQIFNNPELTKIAKDFNIDESQINQIKSTVLNPGTPQQFSGNLTPEQLELIKKFKR